ncbi:MAG: hypothetical protein M3P12_12075 [Gemmatimonadota bacterium]|nr:hypothetical protein [Gemmatimonadota bacterium]
MTRVVAVVLIAILLLGCDAKSERASAVPQSDSLIPAASPQPRFDTAVLMRARQSITDYLRQNIVSSRGDAPQFEQCSQNFKSRPVASLLAVARARVLDAQPVGPPHGPRPDTISVLAELLVVAQAGPGDPRETTWNVEQSVHLDTVRLTLVATGRPDIEWGLCWAGYDAAVFAGPPAFIRASDSTPADLHWKPPLSSWASLDRLADSVRWSSLRSLQNDSAVTRTIASGNFANRLGVLEHTRDGQNCLTIADSTLPPGTPVLVVPPGEPNATVQGLIEARRVRECMKPGDEWGSVQIANASFYDVVFAPGNSAADDGIVVAARPQALHKVNGVVSIDVDGDGRPESFESCRSREGTHLGVTTGSGPRATKRWEQYVYVPYELEPDCK